MTTTAATERSVTPDQIRDTWYAYRIGAELGAILDRQERWTARDLGRLLDTGELAPRDYLYLIHRKELVLDPVLRLLAASYAQSALDSEFAVGRELGNACWAAVEVARRLARCQATDDERTEAARAVDRDQESLPHIRNRAEQLASIAYEDAKTAASSAVLWSAADAAHKSAHWCAESAAHAAGARCAERGGTEEEISAAIDAARQSAWAEMAARARRLIEAS
jgi:hypothetical protein